MNISMTVNGRTVSAEVEGRTLLVQFLREKAQLTGTHEGCDTSQCGACTVHLNGRGVKSCTVLAAACAGASVTTIEGLAQDGKLHPMQEAFREHHGLQCGFCTPGMIMTGLDMVNRLGQRPRPADDPPAARGQPLPLHRLPQHRESDTGRRRGDEAENRSRTSPPAGWRSVIPVPAREEHAHRRARAAPGRPAPHHRQRAASATTSTCRDRPTWRSCARRTRTRASRRSTPARRSRAPACSPS